MSRTASDGGVLAGGPDLSRADARPAQQAWRAAFVVYALALAAATHWPQLKLDLGPIPRPDLLQHLLGFGAWTALLAAAGWFGPWNSWRNIALAHVIAVVYAGADEGSQAIPGLNRVVAWDDFAFNCIGVWAGTAGVMLLRWWRLARGRTRIGPGHP